MYTLERETIESNIIKANKTQIGDLMEIIVNIPEKGHILLNTYDGIISLTDPHKTWPHTTTIEVKLLNKDEAIILIVK